MSDYEGKYIHLGDSYDKDWFFIKDDKELDKCKKDGSFEGSDIIVEVKAIYRVNRITTVTFDLVKVELVDKEDGILS